MTRRSERPGRDGAAEAGRTGGRWRLRNWRLRTKLLAILLIPAVAVVVLVGLRVGAELGRADRFAESAERVRVDAKVAELVHRLQRERDLTVRYVAGGRQGDLAEVREQRGRVDDAIGAFSRELVSATPRLSAGALDAFRRSEDRLGVLTGLRYAGEHSRFPSDAVLRSYSELISGLLDIGDQAVSNVPDGELARTRFAVNALGRIKEQMSVRRAIVAETLARGSLPEDRKRALVAAESELAAAREDFVKFASPAQQRMYDDTVIGLIVDIGNGIVESVLTSGESGEDLGALDAERWDTAATYTVNLANRVQDALLVQLQQRADRFAADARRSALVDAGLVLGVLVVAAVLAVIVTRSLLRPLRILRHSALETAEHRLPAAVDDILADPDPGPERVQRHAVEPVPVFTREELGQVARAFDAVHGEAVRLAGDQAMLRENVNSMFVNLSRRSKDLVERQLSVLDRMEADEQDPDTLGGLFELDHLATRMRRNSENLLVLAGQDAGPPLPGPVSADEIMGAALSEVEHYQRIRIGAMPNIAVAGDAVGDLVHVISELFENATEYSGPDAPVTVASSATERGDWRIDITDRGAGMPAAEIERVNARLADPPEVDVEVSRRMGLYVVARLAQRHRIQVRLRTAETGGLTATVVVPVGLITAAGPPPVPPPPPPPQQRTAPEPAPQWDTRSTPLESISEHGPPRRAPVEWEEPPEWPTEEDTRASALDDDTPTERLPAYQEVLSQWFQAVVEEDRPARHAAESTGPIEAVPAEHVAWPTEDDERPPIVSRSPEAVRSRMSSLQDAVRRGRHERLD
ncbi:signal transduction histidine kinase [Prauserella shujinwangii]|uniref:histidine kinase n=1 Tax=Prauserella shujinwangii TaxID=1453103 RepID=A0A2T0M142_9PSEU|nr:nitrate- and nitrite sensing domain-containing protein [Prauserella shujinwangii]PRX50277.1 signal transduction histidine kinase [Prauserella shujinwangii]